MGIMDRIRALILTKSEKSPVKAQGFLTQSKTEEVKPASFISQPVAFTAPPPTVKPISFTVAKPPKPRVKVRVLHLLSGVMILLNVVVGLFFVSNNMTLNAALLGYLGISTILLGHYFALTRG